MKRIFYVAVSATLLAGCGRQRDLYVNYAGLLRVQSSFESSLAITDITGQAAAVIYDPQGAMRTEYFNTPDHVTVQLADGDYGVLVLNGPMFSEVNTNLDNIFFRHTSNSDTFEAVVAEAQPNARLSRAEGEYIANNDMEPLASAWGTASVKQEDHYLKKYDDGREQSLDPDDYTENTLTLLPRPLSYYAKVVVYIENPASAAVANGSLRGMVGSVFVKSGRPSTMRVTHQLPFNAKYLDAVVADATPTGAIETPLFVTFGPPADSVATDADDWEYRFDLDIVLQDGSSFRQTFDIREQVRAIVEEPQSATRAPYNSQYAPHVITIGGIKPYLEAPFVISPDPEPGEPQEPQPEPTVPLDPGPIKLPYIESTIGVAPWDDSEVIVVRPKPENDVN